MAYAGTGECSQAEEIDKQVVAELGVGSAKNKNLSGWQLEYALMALSRVYRQEHKFDEALEAIKRAETIEDADSNSRASGKKTPPAPVGAVPVGDWSKQIELAETYREKGDAALAEPIFESALAEVEPPKGRINPGDVRAARFLDNYATLLRDEGKYDQAEDFYKRALALWAESEYPDHPDVAATLTNYAALLRKLNRAEEAEPLEARASAILAAASAPAPVI
jgi:tetratricopeptide (TPR) repeat protein